MIVTQYFKLREDEEIIGIGFEKIKTTEEFGVQRYEKTNYISDVVRSDKTIRIGIDFTEYTTIASAHNMLARKEDTPPGESISG